MFISSASRFPVSYPNSMPPSLTFGTKKKPKKSYSVSYDSSSNYLKPQEATKLNNILKTLKTENDGQINYSKAAREFNKLYPNQQNMWLMPSQIKTLYERATNPIGQLSTKDAEKLNQLVEEYTEKSIDGQLDYGKIAKDFTRHTKIPITAEQVQEEVEKQSTVVQNTSLSQVESSSPEINNPLGGLTQKQIWNIQNLAKKMSKKDKSNAPDYEKIAIAFNNTYNTSITAAQVQAAANAEKVSPKRSLSLNVIV